MHEVDVLWPKFEKRTIDGIPGLVTVVAQDAETHEVLMVAYTDEAGFRKTLETGQAAYYSTSRKKSWVKGEESGNFQKIINVLVDCDGDALVYLVEMQGNRVACHTEARSCFYRSVTHLPAGVHEAPKAGPKEHLDLIRLQVAEHL